MPITVFTWDPHVDMYGHASMHIHNGPYISWWPTSTASTTAGRKISPMFGSYAYVNNMKGDKASEGRPPSWASAPITCLDEQAIEKWWRLFSGCAPGQEAGAFKTTATYNVLTTSCSGVVYRALMEGGARKNWLASSIAQNLGNVISPIDIKDLASALSGELGFWDTTKFMLTDAVLPGDIKDAVRYLGR